MENFMLEVALKKTVKVYSKVGSNLSDLCIPVPTQHLLGVENKRKSFHTAKKS